MADPKPKFTYREKVRLTRPMIFYRKPQYCVTQRRTVPKGSIVEIREPEVVYNDHGHFSYIQYYLEIQDGWWPWRATVMEETVEALEVLDRLANL